jgi:hypothetical protein
MKSTEIKRPAAEMSNRKGGGTIQQPELCIVNNIVVYTLTMKGSSIIVPILLQLAEWGTY